MKQQNIFDSFKNAFEGIIVSFNERNFKIHFLMMLLVIIAGIILKISYFEWIICIILFSLVISAELFNCAIENIMDFIHEDYDPKIKIIKDASAGAVLILAIGSAIIGLMIFIPKILLII